MDETWEYGCNKRAKTGLRGFYGVGRGLSDLLVKPVQPWGDGQHLSLTPSSVVIVEGDSGDLLPEEAGLHQAAETVPQPRPLPARSQGWDILTRALCAGSCR